MSVRAAATVAWNGFTAATVHPSSRTGNGTIWKPRGLFRDLSGTLLNSPQMTLVVKLGSSIVAADDGELRADVLDSVCAQVGKLERGGEPIVMVTSGAIARGMRLLELPVRPRAMDELQAASAVGQGDLFRAYESRLAEHGTHAAQVLLTAADIA